MKHFRLIPFLCGAEAGWAVQDRAGWDYCRGFEGPHRVLIVRHGWNAAGRRTFEEPRWMIPLTSFCLRNGRAAEPARKQVRIRRMLTMSSGLDPYNGPYRDAEAYAKLTGRRRPAHAAETGAHRLFAVAQRLLGWQADACRTALGKAVPPDTFYMSGFGMQACWIIPSLDMIVVRLGSSRALNSRIDFFSEFLARLMEAVR